MAVAVAFSIGVIVLVVVGDKVIERKAVMGGDEIHRSPRFPATLVEKVRRRRDSGREVRKFSIVALPERPHGIPETVVPLGPSGGEAADLIATRSAIPGLGNELNLAEDWILHAGVEKAAAFIKLVWLSRQNGCQVEAEAINPHLLNPIPKRARYHLQNPLIAQVDCIPRARVVDVKAAVRREAVVGRVIYPLEGEGRAEFVVFRGVVVDNVLNNFDARSGVLRDHFLEFVDDRFGKVPGCGAKKPIVLYLQ